MAEPDDCDEDAPGTGRIEAFSDGVIAIIITIMVLELRIPEHALDAGLLRGVLAPLAPKLVSYGLSFLVVAIMWVNHHQMMHIAPRATRPLLWWNNLLLFWMSLIPLATGFVGDHPFDAQPVAVYGFILFACAAAFILLRRHVALTASFTVDLHAHNRGMVRKNWLGIALYGASVPLAFVSVYLSMAIFVLVPAMFFMPETLPGQKGS